MVCKLPSARSLSKARSEGALRENIAKADLSASAQAISVSPTRSSGRLAKPLCTKRKSASADRCFRPCGATMDMETPITRRSKRSSQGVFSHLCLRKASSADTVVTRLGGSSGIAGELLTKFGLAQSAAGWREYLAQVVEAGATEVAYQPAGPDIARELEVFISAARG